MLLRFHPPAPPWSSNEQQRTVRGRIAQHHDKKAWRDGTYYAAKSAFVGVARIRHTPSYVQVTIPFATNRRRDPSNYVGTVVKAIVDGLVLAGMWPDDNPDWVTVVEPLCVMGSEVVVRITPRSVTVLP